MRFAMRDLSSFVCSRAILIIRYSSRLLYLNAELIRPGNNAAESRDLSKLTYRPLRVRCTEPVSRNSVRSRGRDIIRRYEIARDIERAERATRNGTSGTKGERKGEREERRRGGGEEGSRKSARFPAAIWRTISPVSGKALPAAITTARAARRKGEFIGSPMPTFARSRSRSRSLLLPSFPRRLHFSLFPCLFIWPILQIAS